MKSRMNALLLVFSAFALYGSMSGNAWADSPSFTETVLYSFGDAGDGSSPAARLTLGNDGILYGTTFGNSSCAVSSNPSPPDGRCGTIFKISPEGSFQMIYQFTGGSDGQRPRALVKAGDGNFYGVAQYGGNPGSSGAYGYGTIFKITPDGSFSILHKFSPSTSNGYYPSGELVLGTDGALYGTTSAGGTHGAGTVFRINTSGSFKLLYSFSADSGQPRQPTSALLLASDGNFYGYARSGGSSTRNIIYKITSAGSFSVLCEIPYSSSYTEFGGLTQGKDGNLYGTDPETGVFQVSLAGVLTPVHTFDASVPGHAYSPSRSLVQGNDGAFYGAARGGTNNHGVIYRVTSAGDYSVQYNFAGDPSDGSEPSPLIKVGNNVFYGVTELGGHFFSGTVYKLVGPPGDEDPSDPGTGGTGTGSGGSSDGGSGGSSSGGGAMGIELLALLAGAFIRRQRLPRRTVKR